MKNTNIVRWYQKITSQGPYKIVAILAVIGKGK